MFSETIQKALNDQINTELSAFYEYLAISAFCEHRRFTGCAKWFRRQSDEEHGHAMKLFHFVTARNGRVNLKTLPQPRMEFETLPEVFEFALKQEMDVTERIESLYKLAFEENAYTAMVELQWFISEQVEEENRMRELVTQFNLVRDDKAGLLDLDRVLGAEVESKA